VHTKSTHACRWVVRTACGISDEAVIVKDVPKSMLAAKSFAATSNWSELVRWLRVLCEELSVRMADDSAMHHRRPRNLVVHFRCAAGSGKYGAGETRSRCAPPFDIVQA
jgi:hypothetical protein